MSAPDPGDARLAAVRRIEGTAVGSRVLHRLSTLATRLLEADGAQIGLEGGSEPVADALAVAVVAVAPAPLVVVDATRDPRTAQLPAVLAGELGACLGMPLTVFDGQVVGALTVCAVHRRPWSERDLALLRQLADAVATELELAAHSREFEADRLRFELAIDAAGMGSFDWDLASGRLNGDDRLLAIFGHDRDSFDETITSFARRLHPDDRERAAEALQTAIETVGEYEAEFRIVLPSGETRWILGRGRVVAGADGAAAHLLGAGYDTTSVRLGDARISRILEAMNAAFFALDRQWRFSYVNAEAERVLERSREEMLDGVIWELFPAAVGSTFEQNYRAAMDQGEECLFEAYYPEPLDAWFEVRVWPSPDGLSVYFLDITARRSAEQQARRSTARLALVAEVTAAMQAVPVGEDPDDSGEQAALQRIAEALVPVLGDWVIISLVDEDGRMRDVASWHHDPDRRAAVERYAHVRLPALTVDAPIVRALASGQVRVVDDVAAAVGRGLSEGEAREAYWALAPRSAVTLPLAARGRTVGALSIYRSAEREGADPDDVATMTDVAIRVALAMDNVRLYAQQRRLSEELQRSLLTAPPQPEQAEIVVRYRPAMVAAEVGGDWYDAFLQPSGATVLVIGDVVGHDTAAAAAMGQLRGMLRGIAYRGSGPAAVLTELDVAIDGLRMGTMATAAIVRLEQSAQERAEGTTRLRWSNAGHPAPLVLHADGRIDDLSGERAELMLGVDPAAHRTERVITVTHGATVLLYTDGLVEGRDLPLDEGMARLRAALVALADRPLGQLCDTVIDRLRPAGLQDDVALVALRLHSDDRARSSPAPSPAPRSD